MNVDYDRSEPIYFPIILSIIGTIILILITVWLLIFYFKASVSSEQKMYEQTYGASLELNTLRDWEAEYLNSKNNDKMSIDEAMDIIYYRYRR